MFKHHKYISVIIGLLFVIVLQELSVPQPIFRFLLPIFLIYGMAVSYYNLAYLRFVGKYNRWVVLRPFLLFWSGLGVFLLLPNSGWRGFFLTFAFLMIVLVELNLRNFTENLLVNETLIIAFGFFVSFAGFNQYLPQAAGMPFWPLWRYNLHLSLQPAYLAGVFFTTTLVVRSFYEFIPQSLRTKWVAAVILGLFSSELFWSLSFLPFHYSAGALVLFAIFYFCLILNYYYLYHTLTFQKIQFHLALIALACGIAILATPWRVLS